MTAKQAVLIIAVAGITWLPMVIFIVWLGWSALPRRVVAIGAINLPVGVLTLTY